MYQHFTKIWYLARSLENYVKYTAVLRWPERQQMSKGNSLVHDRVRMLVPIFTEKQTFLHKVTNRDFKKALRGLFISGKFKKRLVPGPCERVHSQ